MPLVKGAKAKTRKGFSENVRREMGEGKKQSQAVAIAYSEARGKKKKAKKKQLIQKVDFQQALVLMPLFSDP